jgi:hypothetical protein
MKHLWILTVAMLAGCASFDGIAPRSAGAQRTFDAPIARVKPAMVSTLVGMGMTISSLEARGGRDVLKAGKSGSRVEVEFERLGPASTRVHVAASNGGLSYDKATAAKIMLETEKLLGKA